MITGTIGSGKTSSAMYPFTRQLIEYKSNNKKEKLGLLIFIYLALASIELIFYEAACAKY